MGRILRITLQEDVPERIDLAMIRPGKILLSNTSTTHDIRVGYDTVGGVGTTAGTGEVNYYTLKAGNEYVFDCGPGVGLVAQQQQLFFNCATGNAVLEVWIAHS